MHRLFGLLAMTAAGLGLFLLLGPDTEPASTGAKAANFSLTIPSTSSRQMPLL